MNTDVIKVLRCALTIIPRASLPFLALSVVLS